MVSGAAALRAEPSPQRPCRTRRTGRVGMTLDEGSTILGRFGRRWLRTNWYKRQWISGHPRVGDEPGLDGGRVPTRELVEVGLSLLHRAEPGVGRLRGGQRQQTSPPGLAQYLVCHRREISVASECDRPFADDSVSLT